MAPLKQLYWSDKAWTQKVATVLRWLFVLCFGLGCAFLAVDSMDPFKNLFLIFVGVVLLVLADGFDWLSRKFPKTPESDG